MIIEVSESREDYQSVTVLLVDEEGCAALHDLFDHLPDDARVIRAFDVNVTEDSRRFRIRFEAKQAREERLRKAAEEEAQRAAERAAREAERLATEQQRAVADLQRRAAVGPTLPEEDNA